MLVLKKQLKWTLHFLCYNFSLITFAWFAFVDLCQDYWMRIILVIYKIPNSFLFLPFTFLTSFLLALHTNETSVNISDSPNPQKKKKKKKITDRLIKNYQVHPPQISNPLILIMILLTVPVNSNLQVYKLLGQCVQMTWPDYRLTLLIL